jgi:hypothetical protein
MKALRFISLYWPVILLILIELLIECRLVDMMFFGKISYLSVFFTILQFFVLIREKIKIDLSNAPILFSIVYLQFFFSDFLIFTGYRAEFIFPLTTMIMAVSFLLIPMQFIIWIIYIDWPFSRLVKRLWNKSLN